MFLTSTEDQNPDRDQSQADIPEAPPEPATVEEFNTRNQGRDSDLDPSQDGMSQDPLDWTVDTGSEAPANGRED